MIKRTVKKPISFLLALFMIFSLTACNNTTTPEPGDTSDAEITVPTKEFTPSEEFLIVRGNMYSSEDTIIDACYYVKKAFEAAYGYKLTIETDKVEATADSYEILIGHTNRKASQNLASTLSLNDYVYAIPSEKSITRRPSVAR